MSILYNLQWSKPENHIENTISYSQQIQMFFLKHTLEYQRINVDGWSHINHECDLADLNACRLMD